MIQIFIADDHESIIDGLVLLFKNDTEINVLGTAKDGKELLEKLIYQKPNVLITDISMPRMNGIELTKKALEIIPNLKIIAFSMFENEDAIKEMIDAGALGYVLKRRALQEVRQAVLTVNSGKLYFDPTIDMVSLQTEDKADFKPLLSPSEREILKLIAQRKTSSEIAEIRNTAVSTIIKHRKNIIQKLKLEGKSELLRYALQVYEHFK